MDPRSAAQWMRSSVLRSGVLLQRDAASFLHQFDDEKLAFINDDESLCVGRVTLARFRRISPDMVYDHRIRGWRLVKPRAATWRVNSSRRAPDGRGKEPMRHEMRGPA
jgi:hypothetical protein